MSRYRKVDSRIWNDAKFRVLTDAGKLAFLFLLTHPNTTALGAIRGSIPGFAAEIGWSAKAFGEAFREASSKGMAEHDEIACIVWFPNFLKYNRPESPNVVRAWASSLDLLPECALKDKAIQSAKALVEGMNEAFAKAFAEALAKAMPNQEQEQEQEQERTLPTADAVGVAGGAVPPPSPPNLQVVHAKTRALPDCPHQQIIALYHEILSECPQVIEWNDERQGLLRARWREKAKPNGRSQGYASVDAGLAYWRRYFTYVTGSKFLTGRAEGKPGKAPFVADLEWLIRPTNFVKVVEGKYHDAAA
ncbi:MAG: hypothetical protein HY661_19340 [Betaproteobacteria bacterium]|nr:hypothetical protein [Betaproteobacteria bacterium]